MKKRVRLLVLLLAASVLIGAKKLVANAQTPPAAEQKPARAS